MNNISIVNTLTNKILKYNKLKYININYLNKLSNNTIGLNPFFKPNNFTKYEIYVKSNLTNKIYKIFNNNKATKFRNNLS